LHGEDVLAPADDYVHGERGSRHPQARHPA
jgi:hypothetical protein